MVSRHLQVMGVGRFLRLGVSGCGPMVSMELRASSRRRRTYWTRLAYVAAMTLYVTMVWMAEVSWASNGAGAFTRSRMAVAGVSVGCGVLWFLILAGPTAAVLLTTNCFDEEIHRGGLTLLLSTPLDYPEIVMGKFIGRLAQMEVLLLAALPVLALARVFGGVPFVFVIGQVALGAGCSMLAAALTMYYSTAYDEPYRIVPRSLGVAMAVNAPVFVMAYFGGGQLAAGTGNTWAFVWLVLAGLQVAGTAKLLRNCASRLMVRGRVVLGTDMAPERRMHNLAGPSGRADVVERALGHLATLRERRRRRPPPLPPADRAEPEPAAAAAPASSSAREAEAPMARGGEVASDTPAGHLVALRRAAAEEDSAEQAMHERGERAIPWRLSVKGSPIVWREMRRSFLADRKIRWIVTAFVLVYLLMAAAFKGLLSDTGLHVLVLSASLGIYGFILAVTTSALITRERQRRCWQLLLTTPLTDWDILWAKIRSALWKSSLPLQIGAIFVAVCIFFGGLSPLLLIHWLMMILAVTAMVLGFGLLCSCRFRRTSAAMMACVGCLAAAWSLGPWLVALLERAVTDSSWHELAWSRYVQVLSPFYVLQIVRDGEFDPMPMRLPFGREYASCFLGMSATTFLLVVSAVTAGYVAAGAAMTWLAKRTFRAGRG